MTTKLNGSGLSREISTRRLKDFALKLPPTHPLRLVLLVEDDKLDAMTFLARLAVWLRLARLKSEHNGV